MYKPKRSIAFSIQSIVIYPVDIVVQLLNNWGLKEAVAICPAAGQDLK